MDLTTAVQRMKGKSELGDRIIQARFSYMLSEASSDEEVPGLDVDAVIEEIVQLSYSKKGELAVRELTSIVLHLLAELEEKFEAPGSNLDDDETVVRAMNVFRLSLLNARTADLKQFYTEQVFLPMKRESRAAIAKELIEHANEQGKSPSRLWLNLVQTNGSM